MMASRLKDLYEELIEKRKDEVEGWHKDYKSFFNEVEKVRKQLKGKEVLLEKEDFLKGEDDFLRALLAERHNGICRKGLSHISEKKFQTFINSKEFICSLKRLIIDPDKGNFDNFGDTWSSQKMGKNPLLVNRTTAACTLKVSTTTDNKKFKDVFEWLIQEGMIPEYQGEDNWFSKNVFLMDHIHDAFRDELQRGDIDKFYLSQFVWKLYQKVFQKP